MRIQIRSTRDDTSAGVDSGFARSLVWRPSKPTGRQSRPLNSTNKLPDTERKREREKATQLATYRHKWAQNFNSRADLQAQISAKPRL